MKALLTDLYSLRSLAEAWHPNHPRVAPTRLLQLQIERGFAGLRFGPCLETDFCRYLRASGRLSRMSLVLLSFFGMLTVMLLERTVLGLPEVLVEPTLALQLGIMMPATIICGLFCWFWPNSRSMEAVMIMFFIAMNIGMLGERIVSSHHGFDVPAEMFGVTIVAMFALARIRFWLVLPTAIAVAAGAVIAEVLFVNSGPSAYYHFFSAALLLFIGIVGGYSSEYFIRWTWLNGTLLRYLSRLDRLTGLLNRYALEEALERALAHAQREGLGFGMAMIDIDAFGAYNNHYGHQAGDEALRRVARDLNTLARRPQDVCGRFGGEEFVLLWMDGSAHELRAHAEQVRATVEQHRITHEASNVVPWVTVSIGLCHADAADLPASLQTILGQADKFLYEAKAGGRNGVVSGPFSPDRREEPRMPDSVRA